MPGSDSGGDCESALNLVAEVVLLGLLLDEIGDILFACEALSALGEGPPPAQLAPAGLDIVGEPPINLGDPPGHHDEQRFADNELQLLFCESCQSYDPPTGCQLCVEYVCPRCHGNECEFFLDPAAWNERHYPWEPDSDSEVPDLESQEDEDSEQ